MKITESGIVDIALWTNRCRRRGVGGASVAPWWLPRRHDPLQVSRSFAAIRWTVAVSWFSVPTQQVRELGWLPSLIWTGWLESRWRHLWSPCSRRRGSTLGRTGSLMWRGRILLGSAVALATAVFIKPERQSKQPTGAAEVAYKAE